MFDDALSLAHRLLGEVRPAVESSELSAQMRVLQQLTSLTAAVQAEVTAAFVNRRRAEQVAAGVPARRVGHGVAHEVASARHESPARAERQIGLATVLTRELPETLGALRNGATSEWRATLIARETGWLSAADRATVDADLGPRLVGLGDRQVEAEAKRLAYGLDPHGLIKHLERAVGGRRVSLRPAPDGMTKLSATLPLAQGVATISALQQAAAAARASGDERTKGQVMADTLVERVTGQTEAAAVPITVHLVMTDQNLLRSGPGADEPATVSGHGPVPAPFARTLLAQPGVPVGLRRLFMDPAGRLITAETTSRAFTEAQREFVMLRDQWCQTPYCGAPIRHVDHIVAHALGGPTSLGNAQGLCEACNYAKGDSRVPMTVEPADPAPPRRLGPPDIGHPHRLHVVAYRHRGRTRSPVSADGEFR